MELRSSLFSRAFAAKAWFLLLSATTTLASVIQGRQGLGNPGNVWITVDATGGARTITPTPTTVNGAVSTISGPPEYLTKTSVYTLTKTSGTVTTSTGVAPVATATATGTSEAGAFIQCSNYQGVDSPFCLPRAGSVLAAGRTYYVTWDSTIFASENQTLQVQGEYADGEGFTSVEMAASAGFYAWTIDRDFLSSQNTSSLIVSLRLAYYEENLTGGNMALKVGPNITVSGVADDSSGGSSPNAAAIAVPVVLGLLIILIAGFCIWSWRRRGHVFGFGKRTSQGYGERQSRSQRTGVINTAADPSDKSRGIQLTDRESWSPTQGRNVFREEIQRQEHAGV